LGGSCGCVAITPQLRRSPFLITWYTGAPAGVSIASKLQPVALTATVMADRYHTIREVRRPIGPMRQKVSGSTAEAA
jgi:hypothetical protein